MNKHLYKVCFGGVGIASDLIALREPTIFCFHSVASDETPTENIGEMAITAGFLERLIVFLRSRKIAIVSIATALQKLSEGETSGFVVITFDDGYRDNYQNAYRVALKHDAPMSVFVTTGFVDRSAPMWWNALEMALLHSKEFAWPDHQANVANPAEKHRVFDELSSVFRGASLVERKELVQQLSDLNPMFKLTDAYDCALTWEMIREMSHSGLIEFGCHTIDHPELAGLGDCELTHQFVGSRKMLREGAGVNANYVAYPFGMPHEVGAKAAAIARQAGFHAAFTTEPAVLNAKSLTNRFRMPRIMLTKKAQHLSIVSAYMSGVPSMIKRTAGMSKFGVGNG